MKKYHFILSQQFIIEAPNIAQAYKKISNVKVIGARVFCHQGKNDRVGTHGYIVIPEAGRTVKFEGKSE